MNCSARGHAKSSWAQDSLAQGSLVAPPIYRWFILAAVAVGLSAGAAWGTWLLTRLGAAGSFTGVSIHAVNAHGQAQLFGWVGLFVMGVIYGLWPRLWDEAQPGARLAGLVLLAMFVGTVLRSGAMGWPSGAWAPSIMLMGGALQGFAVCVFAGQVVAAALCSGRCLEAWCAFVLAALGWLVLMTAGSIWHAWMIMAAEKRQELLTQVMMYQAPLRDVQLRGFALFVLLGIAMWLLPRFFGMQPVSNRRGWFGLGAMTAAVAAMVVLFVAYQWSGTMAYARALLGAWLLLAVGIGVIVWPWRLWRPMVVRNRGAKFIRMAFAWLAVSVVMLILLPVHQMVSGLAFSHAYYGAIRHALGMGFVSVLIMGLGATLVPMLRGLDARGDSRGLSALWGPFVLVNVGCALRVTLQSLSDWYDGAFALVAVSGALELAALTWWAGHLIGWMYLERPTVASAVDAQSPRRAAIDRPTLTSVSRGRTSAASGKITSSSSAM